jgi:hypothetical protein
VPQFGKISFNGIFFDSTELGTHPGLKQFDRYKGSTLQIVAGAITNQETFEDGLQTLLTRTDPPRTPGLGNRAPSKRISPRDEL